MNSKIPVLIRLAPLLFLLSLISCGGGSSSGGSSSSSVGTSLKAGYQQAKWQSNTTVTYSGDCTMTITSNDLPSHAMATYYLAPTNAGYPTTVATNQVGNLSIQPNTRTVTPTILTFNICPTKANTTTATNLGTVGVMISGGNLFNGAEATGIAAMSDNVSYPAPDGTTAYFLDNCNAHYAPRPGQTTAGGQYHYHANSPCVTSLVDSVNGPSHIIGVALDGYPVYGGRDMSGNVISLSQLDQCNGITSPTPEFPNGIYHYVLPEGVTSLRASLPCYGGVITTAQVALAQTLAICTSPALSVKPSLKITNKMAFEVNKRSLKKVLVNS